MSKRHKHHLVPRYRGGTDEPTNLIEVSVTQHAMFHYCEWKRLGNKEDYIAWKFLSGSHPGGWNKGVCNEELSKKMSGKGNPMFGLSGKNHPAYGNKANTPEVRKMNSERMKKNNPMHHKEHRDKISISRRGRPSKLWKYKVSCQDGSTEIITNLKQWAQENGYSAAAMGNVMRGRTKQHKDIIGVERIYNS